MQSSSSQLSLLYQRTKTNNKKTEELDELRWKDQIKKYLRVLGISNWSKTANTKNHGNY